MKTAKKMLIATILVAIMLLNCFLPVLKVSASTDVRITFESNLYLAVKDNLILNKINAAYIDEQRTIIINEDEIAKVTKLSLSNEELTDLTGLEVFTNLSILDLSSNKLTKDSNLAVLSSLKLTSLDLSSNEIEDVSMITNLDKIQTVNLHNQKFDIVHIIELDTSKESDQVTQVSFQIPQIIRHAGYLETEWLVEETSGEPYINWSDFDHKTIKVEVAKKSGSNYVPYKSMATLRINISDSSNILYNSDINMFFIVVDSEERGIHIKDENMYKAVKEQLTKNQKVNSDLICYYTAPSEVRRDLYERTFDEPQVLVITIDDVVNEISSLVLSNKRIEMLDGIEKFVGLKYELDLSGNYIKSIDKLLELEENQKKEEEKLRVRITEKLALISQTVGKINEIDNSIKAEEDAIKEAKKELEEKRKKLEEEFAKLQEEKLVLEDTKNYLGNQISELKEDIKGLESIIESAKNDIKEINKVLIDYKAEKEKLQQEVSNAKEELDTLKEEWEIDAKKGEIAGKQAEINTKNEQIAEREKQIIDLQTTIEKNEQNIEIIQKQIAEKKVELDETDQKISAKETAITGKDAEIEQIVEQLNTKEESMGEVQIKIKELKDEKADLEDNLLIKMAGLYKIYNRIDKLASFATVNLKTITEQELDKLTYEQAKTMFNNQIEKIVSIEDNLTDFEKDYLILKYKIETEIEVTTEKTVQNEDGTTSKVTEIKVKEIEKPISAFFNKLKLKTEEWTLTEYVRNLKEFKRDDILFSATAYCYLVRLFEGTTECVAENYIEKEIEKLELDGKKARLFKDMLLIYDTYHELVQYNCTGVVNSEILVDYSSRMVKASGEINTYVYLPRLRILNINENLIENINRVAEFSELTKLYAYDNEIVSINTINWTNMTKLKVLDLGFNGISNIKPLEDLINIEELNLKKNLISGSFDFDISKLENLKYLNVSENRIDDIEALIKYLEYEARSNNYSDIADYLNNSNMLDIRLNNQILTMKIDKKFEVNENRKVKLPKIFEQIEETDYANTSFGINSINGNVTNDGKYVVLDTSMEGKYNTVVTITNTSTKPSLGSGTSCTITYTVGTIEPVEVMITPEIAEVYVGETQQFAAEVTGDNVTYKGVKWEITGATSSETKISEGGLLKIGADETAEKIKIKAISVYDETKSKEIEVTILRKVVESITIIPETATVVAGENTVFTATVKGENLKDADKKVKWEVEPEKVLNDNGEEITPTLAEDTKVIEKDNQLTLYVGAKETIAKFKIIATSVIDEEKNNEVTATVVQRKVSELKITPETANVEKGKTQAFKVTVNGEYLRDEDKEIIYSVTGNTSKNTKISTDGILTIASDEKASTIKVIATSKYDNSKIVESTVTVKESTPSIKLGYKVEEEYIVGVQTKTPVSDFKEKLAKEYIVVVRDENGIEATTGYMKTGMFVEIKDKENNIVKDENGNLLVYEVIVKGDINSDGVADALDSNLIKAIRNEVTTVLEIQKKAADIDNNGTIDLVDSKLLLYHRAEVKDYCLDYTK